MTEYAYLLWSHEEDGPTDLVVTLDRNKILSMVKDQDQGGYFVRVGCSMDDIIGKMEELLKKDDAIGIYPLMEGWGGLHFQVVKLR